MTEFRHTEYAMGTAFVYWGDTELKDSELETALNESVKLLHEADDIFSLYKPESPLSRLARGEASLTDLPPIVEYIWDECEEWEKETDGWFSAMTSHNTFDPSGLVKSWAAENAALKLEEYGITNFALNAGGDIRISKDRSSGIARHVAIAKPTSIQNQDAGAITVLNLNNTDFLAVATSGTAERGEHIWNPKNKTPAVELQQITVVAKDLITADVFATAAFAAGNQASKLLEKHHDLLEAMVIDLDGAVYATPGFSRLILPIG